jgi:hypothetical protein
LAFIGDPFDGGWRDVMNALFPMEAKLDLQE